MEISNVRCTHKSRRVIRSFAVLCTIFASTSISFASNTGTSAIDQNFKPAGPSTDAGKPGIKKTHSRTKQSGPSSHSGKTGAKKIVRPDTKASPPSTKTIWNYYDISGTTSKELKAQMKEKGPEGYWAYARWQISWTGNCEISLKINYTMPRWTEKTSASTELQANWKNMISKLAAHEKGHGTHGIKAAKAIAISHCNDANEIIQKWAAQDKIYDEETGHGRKQGVVLP